MGNPKALFLHSSDYDLEFAGLFCRSSSHLISCPIILIILSFFFFTPLPPSPSSPPPVCLHPLTHRTHVDTSSSGPPTCLLGWENCSNLPFQPFDSLGFRSSNTSNSRTLDAFGEISRVQLAWPWVITFSPCERVFNREAAEISNFRLWLFLHHQTSYSNAIAQQLPAVLVFP